MASKSLKYLADAYPWIATPFIASAPMRVMSGPKLAIAGSRAGGLGFIGPGAKPDDTFVDLETAQNLISAAPLTAPSTFLQKKLLPIGVGFQLWNGDLKSAKTAVQQYRPCAVWLFAPRENQEELDRWTNSIREVSAHTQIWTQVGTLHEAIDAASSASPPDVLVIQGAEAGGHGRARDGLGLVTLLPEVSDALQGSGIPLIAAGGIADSRGVMAALCLGASGVAMGTRFLASTEARINKGYQQEIIRATDGARSTTRTMLYNHLRGTTGWPEEYSPRGIINRSWHDHQAGIPFEELKLLHDEAMKTGDEGWGPEGRLATYAGAAIGLIHNVKDARVIIEDIRREVESSLRNLSVGCSDLK